MPLVRDEHEGEMWWILGPNNKTPQEASTAGPFKTKKEAFWTALEHNRTLGVNAVYVHGKNENGERSDGDFEEPSEEDFADTTTDGGCPYCGQNLTNTAVCKHFVGSLGDDDAGGDTVTPLYFGWTEHHDESHDNMIECLDGYFEALCGLCDQIVKAGGMKQNGCVAKRNVFLQLKEPFSPKRSNF